MRTKDLAVKGFRIEVIQECSRAFLPPSLDLGTLFVARFGCLGKVAGSSGAIKRSWAQILAVEEAPFWEKLWIFAKPVRCFVEFQFFALLCQLFQPVLRAAIICRWRFSRLAMRAFSESNDSLACRHWDRRESSGSTNSRFIR